MKLRRYPWTVAAAGVLLVYLGGSLSLHRGYALTAVADGAGFVLLLLATLAMVRNTLHTQGHIRAFWVLMSAGCFLWFVNQSLWTYYEVWSRREMPDPFLGDPVLFLHLAPFMTAVALRPHRPAEERKLFSSSLDGLMLVLWWVYLYAFVVFPDEYVSLNVAVYSRNYDLLYLLGSLLLVGALGMVAASIQGGWKKIYWHLLGACAVYAVASVALNAAIRSDQYYSGSFYDAPFMFSVCWFVLAGEVARRVKPQSEEPREKPRIQVAWVPRLAMLALLSLPFLGFWGYFVDGSALPLRRFRLVVTLAATLALGACVYLKQLLLDRELLYLLHASEKSLENLQRMQSQLVQREKLSSLGELVAGAAHEINNPLAAILGYSELLETNPALNAEQAVMARKIAQQARRTRDLVSDLLRFAQQAPSEKALVDLGSLLQRALQTETLRLEGRKIRLQTTIAPDLPRIWGNSNQVFQSCMQIIQNACDALEEVGGGRLAVSARREGDEVVAEFSDTGPGIQEPRRVFDPFYTTKPIGKGAGLGLSAAYGVVQDHRGEISCYNKSEGGAVFVLRFPVATQQPAVTADAAKA